MFATAPLSEFLPKRAFSRLSRIGLTYQFTATSITEPEDNRTGDPTQFIPRIFSTPNIITSRITPTFVYDSRQPSANGIDTLSGTQFSASIGLAGLGGDVRTYQPTISFTQFIPLRRKKSKNAEVFGYRLLAGTVGSYAITDKIRNANSLSYIGGVPYYERYHFGSEYDMRGYNFRSIGPLAPTSKLCYQSKCHRCRKFNGDPVAIPGLPSDLTSELAQLGTFTGASGVNSAFD